LCDLPRTVPRLLIVLEFESQVRSPVRTDEAALQEARVADRPEATAPVTSASTRGIGDAERDLVLDAKSKEKPRAQRCTNFWIAANDWP
jgi:hypothetical protein